jgi:hypothetical protein
LFLAADGLCAKVLATNFTPSFAGCFRAEDGSQAKRSGIGSHADLAGAANKIHCDGLIT